MTTQGRPDHAETYYVPKDSLRVGSTLVADPPWPSVDVVRRSAYDELLGEVERLTKALASVDEPYPLDIFPERTDEQRDAIFAAMRQVDKYATEWFYAHVARDRGRVAREILARTVKP